MHRRDILSLAALLALPACSPLSLINALAPADGVARETGVQYGPHPRNRMDIYRPTELAGPFPTVLFFYGGSWKRGRRENYAFIGDALTRRGFMAAIADYRVYPEVKFPAFVDDGAAALAWLHANAHAHGGSTDEIHLMGHSAGAYIAAMLALNPAYLARQNLSRDILGRWVGLAGPYAFHPSKASSVSAIFEGTPDDDARPIVFAGPGAPPALLLHGEGDTIVLPENSTRLAEKLRRSGVEAQHVLYPTIGHAPLVLALGEQYSGVAPALDDSVRFLREEIFPKTIEAAA